MMAIDKEWTKSMLRNSICHCNKCHCSNVLQHTLSTMTESVVQLTHKHVEWWGVSSIQTRFEVLYKIGGDHLNRYTLHSHEENIDTCSYLNDSVSCLYNAWYHCLLTFSLSMLWSSVLWICLADYLYTALLDSIKLLSSLWFCLSVIQHHLYY